MFALTNATVSRVIEVQFVCDHWPSNKQVFYLGKMNVAYTFIPLLKHPLSVKLTLTYTKKKIACKIMKTEGNDSRNWMSLRKFQTKSDYEFLSKTISLLALIQLKTRFSGKQLNFSAIKNFKSLRIDNISNMVSRQ